MNTQLLIEPMSIQQLLDKFFLFLLTKGAIDGHHNKLKTS